MAKNITIAEGSQAKNFNTVHKLRTNLIGGGTQYWVPEDEAGAYAKLSEKSITANGTYNASDDSKDGYSKVIVNVPPTRPNLTSKSVNQNGSYRAIDDGFDGYSQVNVNVAGVNEATVVLKDPIGGDGNEHHISADPTTKKPIDTVLPSYIVITTLPTKTEYQRAETIDLTGIVVKAFKNDGTIWEDTGHPGGIIPINELVLEDDEAHLQYGTIQSDGSGINVIRTYYFYDYVEYDPSTYPDGRKFFVLSPDLGWYSNLGILTFTGGIYNEYADRTYLLFTRYNHELYVYRITGDNNLLEAAYWQGGLWHRIYQGGNLSQLLQWSRALPWTTPERELSGDDFFYVPESTKNPITGEMGELEDAGMMAKIKWARPKDGMELTAVFPIIVNY